MKTLRRISKNRAFVHVFIAVLLVVAAVGLALMAVSPPVVAQPTAPDGDVGPNHYVEIINLVFAVYDKQGNRLTGPTKIGDLWAGFAIPDCTDPSGDPIALYDQLEDRWILSQFTTSGLFDPTKPFWNCVAISTPGDPTGTYY